MHDIRYDALHDEIVVGNPFARAILTFSGKANGEAAPIRTIQGPHTGLTNLDRLDIDPVHNEIFIPKRSGEIFIYSRESTGDVAPIRIISGPDTGLKSANGIAVDPVHNLIIVGDMGSNSAGEYRQVRQPGRVSLRIFNRTDNGNVKPRAVIQGLNTQLLSIEQMTVNPATGWILVPTNSGGKTVPDIAFIGVWHINDNGDVPPRWKLTGPQSTLKKPRGIALNPPNKELIVADMALNAVFTFYFPEIF